MSPAQRVASIGLPARIVSSFRAALGDLDPARLVEEALPKRPPKRARVRAIAAGKAATAMMRGALARWGDRIDDALVVTVEPADLGHADVLCAGHPLPDDRSEAAAREALRRARELAPGDLLLALISGGASALLSLPPEGMPLDAKRAVVAGLLDAGAPIHDVNTVRRHLSRIKGGRLATAAGAARVLTLLVSDVIDGAPHDIGSGPTVADPTSVADAAAALRRWLGAEPAAAIEPLLSPSLSPEKPGHRLRARVLADPPALARAVADRLARDAGLSTTVCPPEQGDAAAIVRRRVEAARALAPGEAVVIPCEPTLALPPRRGRGGRAGWIALAAARELPDDVALLCGASDGADGSSGAAGAIVSRAAIRQLDERAIDEALAAFDDAAAHAAAGTAIVTGPTGTNLTDVHVIARAR